MAQGDIWNAKLDDQYLVTQAQQVLRMLQT